MWNYLIFLLIPLLLALINFNHWWFFKTVVKTYDEYIKELAKKKPNKKLLMSTNEWLKSNLTEIKRRIKQTPVDISVFDYMENIGGGQQVHRQYDVIDNFLRKNQDNVDRANEILQRTKGYYFNQFKNWVSPLYWAEIIIYLPNILGKELGFDLVSKVTGVLFKIIQFVYWLVTIFIIYTSI